MFTILAMMFSFTAFSQKTITLNPEISIQLPKNASAFDDKEYKESMNFYRTSKIFSMYTKDIYKIDNIVIRIVVFDDEYPSDFIKKEKEASYIDRHSYPEYYSAISSFNGNEQLITAYNVTPKGHYQSYIYNIATKKCVNIHLEYSIKDGNKKKAEDILNEMSKSIVFK
jgi:hypothetical protein